MTDVRLARLVDLARVGVDCHLLRPINGWWCCESGQLSNKLPGETACMVVISECVQELLLTRCLIADERRERLGGGPWTDPGEAPPFPFPRCLQRCQDLRGDPPRDLAHKGRLAAGSDSSGPNLRFRVRDRRSHTVAFMGRKEIVQKPVVKIFDDHSGEELPETTKPVRYQFNDRAYNLYLSEASKRAVDQFIADLTAGADEIVTGARRKAPPIKAGYSLDDLRAWARANGHDVSDNRRASNSVIDAFNAAH